jgi:Flp pilus assembly protein TadD
MFRRAYELDPLSPGAGEMLASTAAWAGEDGEAREVLARLREFNPRNPRVYLAAADYYMEKKDFDEAQKMIDAARGVSPSEPVLTVSQGMLYGFTGRRKEAEDALSEVLANENETFRLNGELWVQCALGNLDEAFRVLMREAETRSWPSLIKIDPLYADLRKDPRYPEFCAKVGIKP